MTKKDSIKIAIIGTSKGKLNKSELGNARKLGKMLAHEKFVLLTGACGGIPLAVARSAFLNGGKIIGYSPGENLKEHINKYSSPVAWHTKINFCKDGLLGREVKMINNANVIISFGGNVGTLSEICMAIKERKPIIVLTGSGGCSNLLKHILSKLTVYPPAKIKYIKISTNYEKILCTLIKKLSK